LLTEIAETSWDVVATAAARASDGLRPIRFGKWLRHIRTKWHPTRTTIRKAFFLSFDWPILGVCNVLGKDCETDVVFRRLSELCVIAKAADWMLPLSRACFLVERASEIHVENGRLHNPHGAALRYADGIAIYAWKGVRVPGEAIMAPERIDCRFIEETRSSMIRRSLIEIITAAQFVRLSHATLVAEDDCGVLWSKRFHDGDLWSAVEVVNGTPEPDGSIRHYFLCVPSTLYTARDAVAWTYGLSGKEYAALLRRT
jgi:hypothetical protein